MNQERIKELASQARKYADDNEEHWDSGSDWDSGSGRDWGSLFEQKFAELIVRECMDLVKDCYADPGRSLYQTVCASTIIEEHFGVDE